MPAHCACVMAPVTAGNTPVAVGMPGIPVTTKLGIMTSSEEWATTVTWRFSVSNVERVISTPSSSAAVVLLTGLLAKLVTVICAGISCVEGYSIWP